MRTSVHHSPSGPTLFARLTAALPRWGVHLRRAVGPSGRIAPVVLVCGVVAGLALTVPVLGPGVTTSFAESTPGLDSSAASSSDSSSRDASSGDAASRSERTGVVQMGEDGAPAREASPSSTATPPEATSPDTTSSAPTSPAEETAAPEETTDSSSAADSGAAAEETAPATAADPGAEGQVLALVNQERAAAGCDALAVDDDLTALARALSTDMRDRGFFSHTDPDGRSPFDRGDRVGVTVLAENIAYGQPDAASVMGDWMNSAGHRANILNCSYTRLGVGIAYGPGGPWWTQDFA